MHGLPGKGTSGVGSTGLRGVGAGMMKQKSAYQKRNERDEAFEQWWQADGRFYDPDTEGVSWFDKRKELAAVAFQAGVKEEQKAVRQKITKMLGQVKRIEIYQSAQVTLQELIVWLDEPENKVAENRLKSFKHQATKVTREFSTMYESGGRPVFL